MQLFRREVERGDGYRDRHFATRGVVLALVVLVPDLDDLGRAIRRLERLTERDWGHTRAQKSERERDLAGQLEGSEVERVDCSN